MLINIALGHDFWRNKENKLNMNLCFAPVNLKQVEIRALNAKKKKQEKVTKGREKVFNWELHLNSNCSLANQKFKSIGLKSQNLHRDVSFLSLSFRQNHIYLENLTKWLETKGLALLQVLNSILQWNLLSNFLFLKKNCWQLRACPAEVWKIRQINLPLGYKGWNRIMFFNLPLFFFQVRYPWPLQCDFLPKLCLSLPVSETVCVSVCVGGGLCVYAHCCVSSAYWKGLITRCHRDELGCCSLIHALLFAVCFKVQSLLQEFVASIIMLWRSKACENF